MVPCTECGKHREADAPVCIYCGADFQHPWTEWYKTRFGISEADVAPEMSATPEFAVA